MKRIFAAFVVAAAAASIEAHAQQVLPLVWKNSDSVAPGYSWFSSSTAAGDNFTRGMAKLSGGNLLIADRSPADTIRRIDPATGLEVSPALSNSSVITGGTFTLNKVGVSGDNKIYVAGLGVSSASAPNGTIFKIYRFDSDTQTTPTLVYQQGPAANLARLGDDMDVTGSGNNTKILVAGSSQNSIAVFSTTDAGATFQKTAQFVPSAPTTTGSPNVSWDDGSTASFWWRQSTAGNASRRYDATTGVGISTATSVVTLSALTAGANAWGPIDVKTYNGIKLMAVGPANVSTARTNVRAQVHYLSSPENSSGNAAAWVTGGLERTGGSYLNANGSGDILISPADNRLYVLYTNNSISAWSIAQPTSASGEWNLLEE